MPNLGQHFILLLLLLCVHMCVLTWVWVPEHVCEGQRTIFKIPFSSATWFFRRRLHCCFCHIVYSKSCCLPLPSWWWGAGMTAHYTGITWIWLFFLCGFQGWNLGHEVCVASTFTSGAFLPAVLFFFIILIWDRTSCFKLRLASNSCQIKTITLRDGGGPHF